MHLMHPVRISLTMSQKLLIYSEKYRNVLWPLGRMDKIEKGKVPWIVIFARLSMVQMHSKGVALDVYCGETVIMVVVSDMSPPISIQALGLGLSWAMYTLPAHTSS